MASPDSTPLSSVPLTEKNENVPVTPKIEDLAESRKELLNKIQNLKQDLQGWRSKLDTQVKAYQNELSEIKNSLNAEVDKLRADFQELRTVLQQQQDDVTASLRNFGLHDEDTVKYEDADVPKSEIKEEIAKVVPKEEIQDE